MSVVHYRFKASRDWSKVTFDGMGISVYDFKKEVIQQKKLMRNGYVDCDLIVANESNEDFTDETSMINKNSKVILRRVPIATMKKHRQQLAQQQQQQQHQPQRDVGPYPTKPSNTIVPGLSINASEEDRIKAMVETSADQWEKTENTFSIPLNLRKKKQMPIKEPPPNYVCYRCNEKGHFINQCPTNNDRAFDVIKVKRTTGIPKSFLRTVDYTQLDENAQSSVMYTDDGNLVIVQTNTAEWERFNQLKKGSTMADLSTLLSQVFIPPELTCPLCKSLLRDAVTISCCKTAYCDDCIRKSLVEDLNRQFICPSCLQDASPDQLSSNKPIRQKVDAFLKDVAMKDIQQKEKKETDVAPATITLKRKEDTTRDAVITPSIQEQKKEMDLSTMESNVYAVYEADLYSNKKIKLEE